jgi:exodeoxyribonuclease VII large subunit
MSSYEFDFSAPPPPPVARENTREVYTPSRLNREARTMLERGFAALWVEGEMSNLSRPSSGHWYFSLKDDAAQLRCAMFRQKNQLIPFTPKDGMHVQIRGRVSLYEARGDYQFLVDHIEEAGEGALRRQFELLKAKLAAEGLFAAERKRPLPKMPRRIGVITSPTGAAIRDVLHILKRRFCTIPVLIYPVPVQGAAAAPQIARAIRAASVRAECDVLILARGGGSLEDLWAFNEEIVARAIYDCAIPIVSGVGHEVDFTIADLVADVRAPTPSGAAERVAPDCSEWTRSFAQQARRLAAALERQVARRADRLTWLNRRLAQLHPGFELRQRAQRLDELEQRLLRGMRHGLLQHRSQLAHAAAGLRHASPALRLAHAKRRMELSDAHITRAIRKRLEKLRSRLDIAGGRLNAVSPLATLQRGYAIVTDSSNHVVTDAAQLTNGELIEARLAKGIVRARVESSGDRNE